MPSSLSIYVQLTYAQRVIVLPPFFHGTASWKKTDRKKLGCLHTKCCGNMWFPHIATATHYILTRLRLIGFVVLLYLLLLTTTVATLSPHIIYRPRVASVCMLQLDDSLTSAAFFSGPKLTYIKLCCLLFRPKINVYQAWANILGKQFVFDKLDSRVEADIEVPNDDRYVYREIFLCGKRLHSQYIFKLLLVEIK